MTVTDSRPPRRTSDIVLTVVEGVLALLALLVPVVSVQVGSSGIRAVPVLLLPLSSPVQRPADAVVLIAALLLIVALILPTVLLLRALVVRRAGRVGRVFTALAGIGAVLWGIFFAASALAPPRPAPIIASVAITLAGAVALVGQSAVLAPLIPRRVERDPRADES